MGVELVKRARACGFKGSKQATLIALADRANEKRLEDRDCCWPSLATLAKDAGYCVRTVQNRLNELEQEQQITRYYQAGRPTKYRVHPGGMGTPAKSAGVQELHPTAADFAANPRKHCGETRKNRKKNRDAKSIGAVASRIMARLFGRERAGGGSDPVDPEAFSAFVKSFGKQQ